MEPNRQLGSEIMDKRQQILDTATMLFGRHGFHAVGVDWIIAKSNVSKMTMYRYFPSKGDLVVEVLRFQQRVLADQLNADISDAGSPMEALERVFDWHTRWFGSECFSGSLFAHAASEFADKGTQIHTVTVAQKHELTATIEKILTDITGESRASALAPIIVMMLDGATLQAQLTGRLNAASDAWKATKSLVSADAMAMAA